MTTITITDLPDSRALDYRAMSAIRGAAGAGDWCLYAFTPYQSAPTPGAIYNPNYFADQTNPQVQNPAQVALSARAAARNSFE